jgi:CBS domain-containing protein
MSNVAMLLRNKGKGVWTVSRDTLVYDSVELMVEKNVGALVVTEHDRVIGIITERDLARKLILKDRSARETSVGEIMSRNPVCVNPEHTVDACMSMMADNRIRHLPVVENDKLVGLVSVRDVVREIVSNQEFMIMQLEDYIMACPPHMKSGTMPAIEHSLGNNNAS